MPLEVPFSSSIVLVVVVVVVVDIVYVVVSRGQLLSRYPSPRHLQPSCRKIRSRQNAERSIYAALSFSTVFIWHFGARFPRPHMCCARAPFAPRFSVGVITFVFVLTLHRRTENLQNTWEIELAQTE